MALLWMLLKAGPHASVPKEGAAESKALYLVGATFFLLALYIIYEAVGALLSSERPESSTVAIVLSAVSLVVTPVSRWLRKVLSHTMRDYLCQGAGHCSSPLCFSELRTH